MKIDYSMLSNSHIKNIISEVKKAQYNQSTKNFITRRLYSELNNRTEADQNETIKSFKFWAVLSFIFICLSFILFGITTKSGASYAATDIYSIKWYLDLEHCRTVQEEDEHINNWHMYAMDIACVRWQSFEVKAPLWKDIYEVRSVWYDDKLWDFVILKHWEYWFVFGHTKSTLKKWDRINSSDIIGEVNISGITENYHLHFELWKNDYNISYMEMLWEDTKYNTEYTYKLRKQRWWYLWEAETMDFIADFEWFRECAYPDWKQWSIWYGTKSYSWECITKTEAKRRKLDEISRLMEIVYKNYRVDYHNQRMALVSAMYNLWPNSSITEVVNLKTEKSIKKHFNKYVYWVIDWEKVKLWGLVTRRDIEADLYLNNL